MLVARAMVSDVIAFVVGMAPVRVELVEVAHRVVGENKLAPSHKLHGKAGIFVLIPYQIDFIGFTEHRQHTFFLHPHARQEFLCPGDEVGACIGAMIDKEILKNFLVLCIEQIIGLYHGLL